MWTHVIVEDLHSIENRAVLCLEWPHNAFAVTDLSVHALHLAIVMLTRQFDRTRFVKMSHKIGLGSGFNDHKFLQYQLSSLPRYTYFLIQPKGCRNRCCKKLIG